MTNEQKNSYTVPDMNCQHCEQKVSAALKSVPGVISVSADSGSKQVSLEVSAGTVAGGAPTFDALAAAVKAAGYTLQH